MQQVSGEVAEFTLKAVAVGVLLGIVFGAANAYLGLRVGMTVSASSPAAVMTVAVFSLLRTRGTILDTDFAGFSVTANLLHTHAQALVHSWGSRMFSLVLLHQQFQHRPQFV